MLWNDALVTGIGEIDDRHRELFDQIDAMISEDQVYDPAELLNELEAVALRFFSAEQALHEAAEYPAAALHRRQHDGYMAAFRRIKRQLLEEGLTLANMLAFRRGVVEWLKRHIMSDDMDFARHYYPLRAVKTEARKKVKQRQPVAP